MSFGFYLIKAVAAAATEEHRKIIEEQAADNFSYAGYFPAKMGASGKMLVVDQ